MFCELCFSDDSILVFSINATRRLRVSCEYALQQINTFLAKQDINKAQYTRQFKERSNNYHSWRKILSSLEAPREDGIVSVPYLASRLRVSLPQNTIYVLEAVTNAGHLIHHLNLTKVCFAYSPGFRLLC
jgi:ribosomal protein L18E